MRLINGVCDTFSTYPTQPMSQNLIVRKLTNQRRVTSTILDRRLKLLGHTCRADPSHDHAWALQVSTPSTLYHRICDVRAIVPASPGCGQSRETPRHRTSASPQLGLRRLRRHEPLHDDDGDDYIHLCCQLIYNDSRKSA